jgi:DNA polymerase-1
MKKTEQKRKRLVLLDTHAIIHRAYHALPELTSPAGEAVGALYGLSTMLMRIVKELSPDYIVATYDLPGPTHRHEVYKEYKAKRPKIEDALVEQLGRSRDVLAAFGVPIYAAPGFEADDCIGTIVSEAKGDYDIIIASGDMDTMQLIDDERVRVFTLRKGLQDTVLYDEAGVKARYGFPPERIPDFKGFSGDPSDNIIGIPGIGEKTATALLSEFGSMEGVYKAIHSKQWTAEKWKKAGFSERIVTLIREHEDEAEFSKVLATIRTDAPIDFKKPEKAFAEELNGAGLVSLFTELGFRSLVPRVENLLKKEASGAEGKGKEAVPPRSGAAGGGPSLFENDSPLFKETAVMLWLTNSDITNPTIADVLNNTNSKTIEEAHEKLSASIKEKKLSWVYEHIEKPLIPVVDGMGKRGVLIDAPYLKELSKEYTKELQKIAKKIHSYAGMEFNISSPKQLGDVLFGKLGIGASMKRQKKTATGQLSTRESELAKLKDEHPIIEEILAHRTLSKLLGTYIDAIPLLLDSQSRLHTTFTQTGAATGRMASKDPGLQNIPVKTELGRRIRHAFVATPGFLLAAFDYSQIELRIAAFLSEDEKLIDIFKRGEDVHAAVAAAVFNVAPDKVDHEMRRRAKAINFGILYGMGANALKVNLENGGQKVERADAQAYLNEYFSTFSGLAAYLAKIKAEATRKGYTETLFGRRRYFPGLKSRLPFMRAEAERQALNAPMQGTQADIIKLAMVEIDAMFRKEYAEEAYLLLQVHDELIFEIKKENVNELAPKILDRMQSILTEEQTHGVPILSSSAIGPNWGEMKKL